MASIEKITTKAGEPRYRVRWWANGRRVEVWHKNLADARAEKVKREADSLDGTVVDPRAGARKLKAYFSEWLDSRLVKGRPLTLSTRLGYERLYRRNIAPRLGSRQLRALRPETIRAWHAAVTMAAGPDQAAKSYRLLRAVLATAEADELIRQSPCRLRGAGQENHAERPMVTTSLVLELSDAIDERYRALVLLAGFGGLRTGESLGLVRSDVDLLHGEVRVERQAQEVGGGRVVLPPKSDAGRRVVVLPRIVLEALEEHLHAFTGAELGDVVFVGPKAPRYVGRPSPEYGGQQ